MSNYDWIQIGVKAVIHGLVIESHENGTIDIIEELVISGRGNKAAYLVGKNTVNSEGYRYCYEFKNLKPYIEDDKTTTWESIADLLGVDIRRVKESACN